MCVYLISGRFYQPGPTPYRPNQFKGLNRSINSKFHLGANPTKRVTIAWFAHWHVFIDFVDATDN